MVPVELQLKNFLSYGTDAPPLDFDQFRVACLSGKNGQGKSALLDAMTWAVWGEARKSSGKRKPDDELIRIGTRHMEVTFVFDVEGERYRVTRSYSRSATGKTTTSDLEFQLYVPDADTYRPLTGATQRETQERIEDTLGLDYDTFINSAFLLQGRSDEFTKKRPSQRKEILASILNLSRYEALASMARDRWRAAKHRQQRAEAEVERLEEALEGVPAWKEERDEVEGTIERKQGQLQTLRAEEKALTEQKAELEAKAREADSVRRSIDGLKERVEQHENDARQLEERIQEAEELIAHKDEIQRDYERYEKLQQERDTLDEKRDLHRGIEKQIEQKRSAIRDRKNELEKRLNRLEVEHTSTKKELQTCTQKLAQRSAVREKLVAAREAQKRLERLNTIRQKREHFDQEIAAVEQALVGQREALKAKLEGVKQQIETKEQALADHDDLKAKTEKLEAADKKRQELQAKLEATREKGKKLAKQINARSGQLEARRDELDKQEADFDRFQGAEDGVCPTCGSDLTPDHRAEVESSYRTTIQELQQNIKSDERWLDEQKEKRDALRRQYRTLQEQLDELSDVPERLATAREQLRTQREARKELEARRREASALQERLKEENYGHEYRKRRQALRQQKAALGFDEAAYETVQNEAAQLERYEDRLRELEEYAGKKEQLERSLQKNEKQAAELRQQLENGEAFQTLRDEIERLETQLDDVGFDPERFDEVRKALKALSGAGSRMKDLVNAQQNREDWKQQLSRTKTRIEEAREERQGLRDQLETLEEELNGKAKLEERQQAKAEEVRAAEQELNSLQQRLGKLSERLKKAERDRKALKQAKEDRAAAKSDRALYKHLRKAFGKHGIPSLIIEETLPEIEERANLLLDRLTDGKMHIRLETLKDKKTGGTKETLEIIITDEQGVPRPYETFSGGESFRVNFALRIALAQLLAERSGVRIRTLVIDEGFGTQDVDGIERLVEAIRAIKDDFAKIIVITHLEQLKQVFPVRIEVEKDPVTGSSFELLGAG